MEEIMNELIEIENSADEFIKRAEDERKKLPGRISAKVDEIKKSLAEETKVKIKEFGVLSASETEEALIEIKLTGEKKIAAIDAEYKASKEDWINQVFKNVLYVSP